MLHPQLTLQFGIMVGLAVGPFWVQNPRTAMIEANTAVLIVVPSSNQIEASFRVFGFLCQPENWRVKWLCNMHAYICNKAGPMPMPSLMEGTRHRRREGALHSNTLVRSVLPSKRMGL